EGSIPLVIQLRDEDDDPDDDEISDIDLGGGRDLDMSIDLAKCIALEPGAISGDITGSCGTTLTSWGTDSDRSQIWFRIIPPNAPPEAAAGPDQIINEADVVALTGSFTDPNVEDTHTFLWHLESSTNGQTVPNAHGQSVSFTAIDNGVYTFSFTVTDNHGASDTDEVVVTALNVAPVPIIEQLTDETGAEIGVDVPVALVGLEVDLEATFTDVGILDTHTATLEWGEGNIQTTFGWFVDSTGGIPGFVAADHVYVTAGSYSIVLHVTDNDGDAGSASVPIEVVDAAGAVEAVAELLLPLAANPDIQKAIDKLIGNNDGLGDNGALDLLDEGNLNAALEKIKQALEYMEAAEASDPGLDLSYEKGLLALAAKSVALGAIADAQAVANASNDLRKIATAEGLVDLGDDLLTAEEHVEAAGNYQEAVRAVQG
ncbi:MAG: PKD domain-containing protein, partial [Acidimicrobiia bacterium]|nr:PKD domain-containing protein [Acidimicrobiia bacterium]